MKSNTTRVILEVFSYEKLHELDKSVSSGLGLKDLRIYSEIYKSFYSFLELKIRVGIENFYNALGTGIFT